MRDYFGGGKGRAFCWRVFIIADPIPFSAQVSMFINHAARSRLADVFTFYAGRVGKRRTGIYWLRLERISNWLDEALDSCINSMCADTAANNAANVARDLLCRVSAARCSSKEPSAFVAHVTANERADDARHAHSCSEWSRRQH